MTTEKITSERIGTYIKTALQTVHENGDQLASRDVIRMTETRLQLSEHEKHRYEKTGYIRWESILHFYSIGPTKAGWLLKKKGVWYLTPEGVEALKLSPSELMAAANKKYKQWKDSQPTDEITQDVAQIPGAVVATSRATAYEQAIEVARQEIKDFIWNIDPYPFQDLVAALLRGMGYHTPFIAPRGKDGGLDILAYRDPFGSQVPRIKVQVKHRDQKATVQEVRQLIGLLNKDGDTGLFVSSSGFTQDALDAMVNNNRHVEKIDLDSLIDLWEKYYDKLNEEDKALLPLRQIFFLSPES